MVAQHDGDEHGAEHEQEDVGKHVERGGERHDADEDEHAAHELGVRDAGFHRWVLLHGLRFVGAIEVCEASGFEFGHEARTGAAQSAIGGRLAAIEPRAEAKRQRSGRAPWFPVLPRRVIAR